MHCVNCDRVFSACPEDGNGCPYCEQDWQSQREEAERSASIVLTAISDRGGETWTDKWGGTGRTGHDFELARERTDLASFLIRADAHIGDSTDDHRLAREEIAEKLIHLACGLLSGGLDGTAQRKANKLVADACVYFEDEQRKERGAA